MAWLLGSKDIWGQRVGTKVPAPCPGQVSFSAGVPGVAGAAQHSGGSVLGPHQQVADVGSFFTSPWVVP